MRARKIALLIVVVLVGIDESALRAEEESDARDKKAEFVGISRSAQAAVDRWLSAVEGIKSYEDEGTVEWKSGFSFGGGAEQKSSFTYAKPDRFRINNMMVDVVSDGKELTVFRKNNRRYITEILHADKLAQIRKHGVTTLAQFSLAEMMMSKDPKSFAAERFKDLNVTGDETIDGDKCLLLEGQLVGPGPLSNTEGQPLKLYLREKDWMLRRVEIDMSPRAEETDDEEEEENPFARAGREMRAVYDLKNIRVNQDIEKGKLTFKAPSGSKKVDQFYSTMMHSGDTAQQFSLSGKPAPEFELDSADGKTVSLAAKKGNVVVLNLMQQRPGGRFGRRFRGMSPQLDKLDQLQRDFSDKGVSVFCIHPGESADEVLEDMREKNQELTVLLDPDRTVSSEYMNEEWGAAIVLIGKDGLVQGRYPAYMTDENANSIRNDVEKLIKGETLAGGKPMTEEQINEADEQQTSYFAADAAEPLNEDRVSESWSVRTQAGTGMFFGRSMGGSSMKSGLWVQTKEAMQEIDPSGKIVTELPIPRPVSGEGIQEEFVVGRLAGRRALVHMSTIQGEEQDRTWGFRPPKGAVITAGDESGRELWSFEVEAKNRQIPQHLTLADIDGQGGDELVFVHDSSLWIVNERGDVMVRKLIPGWVVSLQVEDLDRNNKAEIYIRTQNKLHRFDYRGEK